jgi:hypothetical protein
MIFLVYLIGVPFVLMGLATAFKSWRGSRRPRRIRGIFGGLLIAIGGFAFFSFAAVSMGGWNVPFEWPVGRASQIIQLPEGLQVVTHTASGRIQVYDASWNYIRGWPVDAGGGVFKARKTPNGALEVWTTRGGKRFVFATDGRLKEATTYPTAAYDDFEADGLPGLVPTPLPLWIFAHPFAAWAMAAMGMLLLITSNPPRSRARQGGPA